MIFFLNLFITGIYERTVYTFLHLILSLEVVQLLLGGPLLFWMDHNVFWIVAMMGGGAAGSGNLLTPEL